MSGGSLSDQQLKEFDDYLSGVNNSGGASAPAPAPVDPPRPSMSPKPEPKPFAAPKPAPEAPKPAPKMDVVDEIMRVHQQKVDTILDLLDKIDAKTHKDIVADLVDEMQYQKGIIKREKAGAADMKKLIELASEATQ